MKLLIDWFWVSLLDNVHGCMTLNLCWNLMYGLIISGMVCTFLYKGARSEGSYYSFNKTEVIPTSFCLMLGMVLIAPSIPMKQHPFVGVIAYGVFYVVFAVTSYTDRQTHFFTAGYMMAGVFINLALALLCMPGYIRAGEGKNLLMAGAMMVVNLIFGTFAYRFGDALLYFMAQCLMIICLPPDMWLAAMIIGLFSAGIYSIVWYGGAFIKNKGGIKSRFPFTTCLFLGSLTVLFLFL